ncbi:Non-homologous end joining protein Ku [Streptomyces sp. RB17]|uniref:non-homologous end joining protein Ku n=1 Tax=Streptomyces sp. RB17 TaxID=2585197 RepID=UPI001296296E|nr:Ku protein [Streptomyces sp. RB17]MQY34336.1 Non-homologous end joining protein Ku [Streptomyces sp. RB17]
MARPIWTGVLTFGLVTMPVGLYTATEDHTVHFHQLQRGTSDRIRNKRVNERTGKEVDTDRIVKGYEIDEGEYVVVEPQELEEIAPGRSKVIDLAGFVDLHQVEPVYFARTYYVGPRGKEYVKVYELMRSALDRSDKAGIATLIMRGKEYLTALRAQPGVLVLHTLHWADEVRDPADVVPELPARRTKSDSKELRTAEQLIDALTIDWDPTGYHDTYEERVKKLVVAKREGEEVVGEPEPPEATNVIDLMDVLSRSVEQGRSRGRKGGRGKRATAKEPATTKKQATARKQASAKKRAAGRKEAEDLGSLSKAELYERASDAGVPGRSKMTRDQLVKALARKAA